MRLLQSFQCSFRWIHTVKQRGYEFSGTLELSLLRELKTSAKNIRSHNHSILLNRSKPCNSWVITSLVSSCKSKWKERHNLTNSCKVFLNQGELELWISSFVTAFIMCPLQGCVSQERVDVLIVNTTWFSGFTKILRQSFNFSLSSYYTGYSFSPNTS